MNREKIEEMAKAICGLDRECEHCTASMSYICKAKKYAERAYNAGYRKQSEVVREIFEEIENRLLVYIADYSGCYHKTFDELKKKYTEGNDG